MKFFEKFRGMFAVIKKEFARFFLDRRMLLTTVIMPGLLIYVVYTLMGTIMGGIAGGASSYTAVVDSMPQSLTGIFSSVDALEITAAEEDSDYYKTQVSEGELDIYVVFPADFDEIVEDRNQPGFVAPNVEIYYNSANEASNSAYSTFAAVLDLYEQQISNAFNINVGEGYDLASATSLTTEILSAVVPMVLLVLLFSGCMAVAPESIAGEKERGTLATMLVTPVKRSHIAVGKIISLSCISLLSGISSFLGLILSLPNLMQGVFDGMDLSMFNAGHYLMTLGVMLSTVLLLVGLISVVSALAKSVKEANSYVGPMNIVVLVVGLLSSFVGAGTSPFLYLIPVFNSARLITDVMSLAVTPLNFVITLVSNIVYACALVFVLARMFKSERIMFNK